MKKLFTLMIAMLFAGSILVNAQAPADTVKYWKIGGDVSLTIGQTALVNWASGGVSSFSLNGLFNLHADYK